MKSVLQYLDNDNQYYPTPLILIKDILRSIKFRGLDDYFYDLEEINFLEPCAGDGAICREVKQHFQDEKDININCIEIEKVLKDGLKGQGFNVVGNDFEEFKSIPFYDLIIMNPPFSKGAKFLLKAYDLLNANGKVICILNAETIKNPCTKERELLKNLIERTGEVEFKVNAFKDSEHKTGVEIAIVHLNKPCYENEFNIFGGIKDEVITKEEKIKEKLKEKVNSTDLMTFDKVENAIGIYRNSVKQIFESIDYIQNMKNSLSHLDKEANEFDIDIKNFLEIILNNNQEEAKEKSIKIIRKMVWSYVLKFCDMDKYLYTKQRSDFYNKLDKGSASLPFTRDNILQFFENIFKKRDEYLEKGIIDLFEEITSRHNGNVHYSEGWKTNKNWKINKKIIVNWGVIKFDSWKSDGSGRFLTDYNLYDNWINDLDKVVRKIKNYKGESYTIKGGLDNAFHVLGDVQKGEKFNNYTETEFFELKFYKKGTLHITFKDGMILKELNKIGASLRTDLGYDDYGKK